MNRLKHIIFPIITIFCCVFVTAQKTEKKRPNILFCIADDASYPYLGAYGTTWVETPAFDRVAKEGLLFNNTYTPNPKCGPSRAIVLTGRNSWQLDGAANHIALFPKKYKTFVEELKDNGYKVGYTGKGYAPGSPGKIDGVEREITGKHYNDKKLDKKPTKGIAKVDYAANFNQFLDETEQGKPWFFWYGGHEPHRKFEYGSGIREGGKSLTDIDEVPSFWPDNDTVRTDMLDYAFELEHFDKHLGKMIQELEKRGELDNTVIVVTSDNGMAFPRSKANEYEIAGHMPLAIMWPKGIKNAGRQINDYVSFIDFAPTFLQIAGIKRKKSGMKKMAGQSLWPILKDNMDGSFRDYIVIGRERHDAGRPNNQGYPIRGLIQNNILYIENFEPERWPGGNPETGYLDCDGSPTKTFILNQRRKNPSNKYYWNLAFGKRPPIEMYDLEKDKYNLNNLANNEEYAAVQKAMKEELYATLKKQKDPRILGNGAIYDTYGFSGSEWLLNFYEKYMEDKESLKHPSWVSKTDFETEEIK